MDGLGAFSGGVIGHNWADSFTGSYDQHYTVIYRGSHTATAYFTVEKQANLNSLPHPKADLASRADPRCDSDTLRLPAVDAGPFSEIDQVFQWQENGPLLMLSKPGPAAFRRAGHGLPRLPR